MSAARVMLVPGHGDLQQGGEVIHPRLTGGAQQRQLVEIDVEVSLAGEDSQQLAVL